MWESYLVNGGGFTRNINQKKRSYVSQYPIDVQSVTNIVGESIMEYCGLVR